MKKLLIQSWETVVEKFKELEERNLVHRRNEQELLRRIEALEIRLADRDQKTDYLYKQLKNLETPVLPGRKRRHTNSMRALTPDLKKDKPSTLTHVRVKIPASGARKYP